MRNWNAPVVEELDVEMTANGFFNSNVETRIIFAAPCKQDDERTES